MMKKILLLISISFHQLAGFTNIAQVMKYALTLPDYTLTKRTQHILNPDYRNWYHTNEPHLFMHLLTDYGFVKSAWTHRKFDKLIKQAIVFRDAAGYDKPHTLFMRPEAGSRFIILGPLYGSFHSLSRDIEEWINQGMMTAEFKLTQPDIFIVFDGTIINGTPYIFDTLALVLSVMNANPDRVIYLAGEYEYNDRWKGAGLKIELDERAGDDLILSGLLSRFFATLPTSLVLVSSKNTNDAIRFVALPSESKIFGDAHCLEQIKKLEVGASFPCPLSTKQTQSFPSSVIIQAEDRMISYAHHPGLVLLPSLKGAITWSVFSAPNQAYRDHFGFYYDAFTVLTIGSSLEESTLQIFHRDVRDKQAPFTTAGRYTITGTELGKEGKPIFTDNEPLYVGCSLDLSKGLSGQGKEVKLGISLVVNECNRQGGIHGRRLEVVFMDDEYTPSKARKNVDYFLKNYKSPLFLCNLGSPTVQACLDYIKSGKIFLFFPVTGAPIFRKPGYSIVHWRTSYSTEAQMMVKYLMDTSQISHFAFLYQNDSYGKGALDGARELLKSKNMKAVKEVPYERNTTNFKSALAALKGVSMGALGFFSTALATMEFIRQAGVEFFLDKKLFALSDMSEEAFKIFSREMGLDMVIAEFAPNPATSKIELVADFRNTLKKEGLPKGDVFILEGYIATNFAIEILKKAAGPGLKKDAQKAVQQAVAGLKNYPFKGFTLNYEPKTCEIVHKIWLDTGQGPWLEYNT